MMPEHATDPIGEQTGVRAPPRRRRPLRRRPDPELARFDGRLFGGAGLAICVAALEATTGRNALWVTTQFIGNADIGDRFDCRVEVLAAGYNTTQSRVTATVDGMMVFTALGATARSRDDAFRADLGSVPRVVGPHECAPWKPEFPIPAETIAARGPFATAEFREAKTDEGSVVLWARMNGMTQDRLTLAYLGDFVPSAVLRVPPEEAAVAPASTTASATASRRRPARTGS